MRTFQLSDAKSHKFWTIDVHGDSFTVTYGKVGTAGQKQTKTFATPTKAQAEADKLIKEKSAKGYVETTPKAVTSDRDALEAAVRANPDDAAPYAVLADYLIEKGDPRGEFMQVQLALEDESKSAAERKALQAREKALLKKHLAEWAGEWVAHPRAAETSYDWTPPKGWVPYTFTRGLLTGLEFGDLTGAVARRLNRAPTLSFVHKLVVHGFAYEEDDEDEDEEAHDEEEAGEYPGQDVLLRAPFLRQVRTFYFGGEEPVEYDDYCPHRSHMPGDHVFDFVKQMPDIEDLRVMAHVRDATKLAALPMPRLRVFLPYHGWSYPLDRLAKNPTLTNLAELYCHPHALEGGDDPYIRLPGLRALCRSPHLPSLIHLQLRSADFGDDGIKEIISSGLLKRLKTLDLRHGVVTDAGARALAATPDLKDLDRLDLAWNRIGPTGVAALRATGVNVNLIQQYGETAEEWEFFSQGDIE